MGATYRQGDIGPIFAADAMPWWYNGVAALCNYYYCVQYSISYLPRAIKATSSTDTCIDPTQGNFRERELQ